MEKDEVIHMVGQSCRPDQEAELVRWYEEVHIPELMKFEGMIRAHRCELLYGGKPVLGYPEQKYPKYLNIYVFEDEAAFQGYEAHLRKGAPSGGGVPYSPHDPVERLWRVQYKVVRVWEK